MKNRGFTLIELLAVVAILAALSALILPKIASTLDDAEQKSNLASAKGLIKAAEYKGTNNEITGTYTMININYSTGENTNILDYSGTKPEAGRVSIKQNGTVAMAVKIGNNCYIKAFNSSDIKVETYDKTTCNENTDVFINYTMPELATTGDGLYKAQGEIDRYVYRGTDPNNYIWLDENGDSTKQTTETYRIISYEPDGTVKVVRNEKLNTELAFDERESESAGPRHNSSNTFCNYSGTYYGCNVWGNRLNTYYNNVTLSDLRQNFFYRYFPSASSPSLQAYTNEGTVSEDSTLNTYLNNTWYETLSFKNLIAEHPFNVGGVYYYNYYDGYTGGDKGIEKEKQEESVYTWNGKVGLINITEYTESSTNQACTSVWSNYYYNPDNTDKTGTNTYSPHYTTGQWPCTKENFNYKSAYHQWSLSPRSNNRHGVWTVNSTGLFNGNNAYNAIGVRPSFYLKSSIRLTGKGTEAEPYVIASWK